MSHWYQMNPKVCLYNTALSAQPPCLAGLSLYRFIMVFRNTTRNSYLERTKKTDNLIKYK